jgi:hypothetical protein
MPEDVNIINSSQYRVFVQHLGSSPNNPYEYVGCLSLDGIQHDMGTGEPILCPSSEVRGQYDVVGETAPPPSLPTTGFTQRMDRFLRDFWWDLKKRGCRFNLQIVGSNCTRPDDPDSFDGKILVKNSKLTAFNTGGFNLTEDAPVDLTGSLQIRDFDAFRPLGFGEIADADVLVEVLDGMYADAVQCGDCGTPSDGCQRLYLLTTLEAPATASVVVYSTDGGATTGSDEVDTLVADAGNRMAHVGRYVVVVSETDEAHHFKLQSSLDAGAVGGWTRVGTGYVAANGPRAIWSKSPRQTFVAGVNGYIYGLTSPTSAAQVLSDGSVTTEDLNDIRGSGNTIVVVGFNNAVVVSKNGGKSWASITGPSVGTNLLTVEVVTPSTWWIGTAGGDVYYTIDAGATWTEKVIDEGPSAIQMIRFVDEMVGYMVAVVGGAGFVFRTSDNGYSWHTEDSSYLSGTPASDRFNFVAPCPRNYNVALIGGLAAVGTDGVAALGIG